jgi:hypothetical protein
VTPCNGDGDTVESQKTWASTWVCTSMKPGHDDASGGVDAPVGLGGGQIAEGRDAVAHDADVGSSARGAGSRR